MWKNSVKSLTSNILEILCCGKAVEKEFFSSRKHLYSARIFPEFTEFSTSFSNAFHNNNYLS